MSKAEDMLELHLKAEKILYSREQAVIEGRKFKFDFECYAYMIDGKPVGHDRVPILVEVQGGVWLKGKSGHSSGTGITRDCEKLSLAAVHGYRTIVCTPSQIKSGLAIQWIKEALK